jgi:Na+/H+ antiporter NhaA
MRSSLSKGAGNHIHGRKGILNMGLCKKSITNLAFAGNAEIISASKMATLLASLTAGVIGFLWLKLLSKPEVVDTPP